MLAESGEADEVLEVWDIAGLPGALPAVLEPVPGETDPGCGDGAAS